MTDTARTLCTRALKKARVIGTGVQASQTQINDALADLNGMIGQWNRQRWLVYRLNDLSWVCDGSQTYSIGPTVGDDVASSVRPDRIEGAYLRQLIPAQSQPVDWPVEIIDAREDYSRITLKTMPTLAWYLFYDPTYPDGTLYPWPLPNSQYEMHILTKQILSSFTLLTDEVLLPPEYDEAIVYSLARRLRATYGLAADPEINSIAETACQTVMGANAAIARLSMPRGIVTRSNRFNIYSGQGY